MEIKNIQNKKYIIGGVVFFAVLLIVGFFIMSGSKKTTEETSKKDVLPVSEVIPTIDSSVKVDLVSQKSNKEVLLTIKDIPSGTIDIEYELSYLAKKTLPKGVLGTVDVSGKTNIEKTITLGTCSSGTCVYDEGVDTVKVSLKFNNDSGSKIFEKEFSLN